MTLYVVLGDGEMPAKEVTHQLNDLWAKCEEADTDFWFALEGKPQATDTDKAIVAYFNKYGIHYGLFVTPNVPPSDDYTDVSEYFEVDDLPTGVVALMDAMKTEEGSVLLTLFTDDDRDATLIDTTALVLKSGFTVLGLNDALEPVELLTEEVKELPAETVEAKPKKAAALTIVSDDDDGAEADEPEPLTREYLELLTANEVKEIAKGMGITPGTKVENIYAILGGSIGETSEDVPVSTADTPVTTPVPTPTYAAEHQFDSNPEAKSDQVLVVVHTPTGMWTKWTTLDKVSRL